MSGQQNENQNNQNNKNDNKKQKPKFRLRNTRQKGRQSGNQTLTELLKPQSEDIKLLLAAQTHIGRRVSHTNMKRYIWKRRKDGIHIINLEKTWNKIQLAARIFCAIKNPADVLVMSTRTFGQRGAIKFSHYTGASTQLGKWTPGTLCNPQNKVYREPRLLIVDDPKTCFAALRETSYVGIPVIAFCGIDNNTRFVDCAIPCNNRGRLSIGLIFWLLSREILRMKNVIKRTSKWDASVDLFFYRDPDEIKKDQEAKKQAEEKQRQQQQQEELNIQQQQQQEQQQGMIQQDQNQGGQYDPNQQQDQQQYEQQHFEQQQQQQQQQDNYGYQQQQQQDDNNNYGYQQQQQQEYYEPPPQQLTGWNDQQQDDNQQQQYDDYQQQQQQQQDDNQQQQQQGQYDPNNQSYEVQNW